MSALMGGLLGGWNPTYRLLASGAPPVGVGGVACSVGVREVRAESAVVNAYGRPPVFAVRRDFAVRVGEVNDLDDGAGATVPGLAPDTRGGERALGAGHMSIKHLMPGRVK